MGKGNLLGFLLLLIMDCAMGDVYKWEDEAGEVHYGDSPPLKINKQTVAIDKGPSQDEAEKERQRMKELAEQQEKISGEESLLEPSDKPSQETKTHTSTPDNVACFSPISDLVQRSTEEPYSLVTPTLLAKKQQKLLHDLFGKIKSRASWNGSISELECWGRSSERNSLPVRKIKNIEVRMNADWDRLESLLTLRTDVTYGYDLIYRFKVGDILYFNDLKSSNTTARDENQVEVLTLNQDIVSFFIKRHITTGHRGTRLRGEIRYIEVSDKNLKLIELYYYDGILASSKTWLLTRASRD